MNKKAIIIILAIALVGTFVCADNFDTHYRVRVREGWNLLQGFGAFSEIPSVISGGDISAENIEAIYLYLPGEGAYARVYPDSEIAKMDDEELLNSAFWVYINKDGWLEYDVESEWAFAENRDMISGWNFVGITPDMVGKSFNEMTGDCDFEAVHHFESVVQDWSHTLLNDGFMDEDLTTDSLGLGLIIKVSDDCTLGSFSSGIVAPPAIPGSTSPTPSNMEVVYPDEISGYTIKSSDTNPAERCSEYNGSLICKKEGRTVYSNDDGTKNIHIISTEITSNLQEYLGAINSLYVVNPQNIYELEIEKEAMWFYSPGKIIGVQMYSITPMEDGSEAASKVDINLNYFVIKDLITNYPPIQI